MLKFKLTLLLLQIHQFMAGRIKLLRDGEPINSEDTPALGYDYETTSSEFDEKCGTHNLDSFVLPNEFCPSTFVCDKDQANAQLETFAECIDAMNCQMLSGMTTGISSGSEVALFIHQMIPHHQNAVNMAKALLKSGSVPCDDSTQSTPDCVMNSMMREIINGQNMQIQAMRAVLTEMDYKQTDNCEVHVSQESSSSNRRLVALLTSGIAMSVSLFLVL
jgi:hypothetical protein